MSAPALDLFGDTSPMEHVHVAILAAAFNLEAYQFMERITPETRAQFIRLVRRLILATDMKRHAEFMDAWLARVSGIVDIASEAAARRQAFGDAAVSTLRFSRDTARRRPSLDRSGDRFLRNSLDCARDYEARQGSPDRLGWEAHDALKGSDRELAMVMLLKCADLSHTAMSTPVHVAWSARLQEEVRS